MEAKQKMSRTIPADPEKRAEFLRQLLRETGNRDLFPEKTERAKKLFEGLGETQERLLP